MDRAKKPGMIARFRRWFLILLLKLILLGVVLSVLEVFILRYVDPPLTAVMAWRWVESNVSSKTYAPIRYEWRDLEEISQSVLKAVLASEDQRFLLHHGFDFVELEYALRDAVTDGRVRGASTITMQTARTVFLWPDRTLLRKALEAYYTVLLELLWDKERILEVYLNTVDWGSGVMGAEAACRKYFSIGAGEASPSQAALLAAILPSPHRWSPTSPGAYVLQRQRRILGDMKKMPDVASID